MCQNGEANCFHGKECPLKILVDLFTTSPCYLLPVPSARAPPKQVLQLCVTGQTTNRAATPQCVRFQLNQSLLPLCESEHACLTMNSSRQQKRETYRTFPLKPFILAKSIYEPFPGCVHVPTPSLSFCSLSRFYMTQFQISRRDRD